MGKVNTFEDLVVWQEAMRFSVEIYQMSSRFNDRYSKDQINRAALSISNNISEGFERNSRKIFIYFLTVAKGSCGEVRNTLHFLHQTEQLSVGDFDKFRSQALNLSKQLGGFIKYLEQYRETNNIDRVQEDMEAYNIQFSNL